MPQPLVTHRSAAAAALVGLVLGAVILSGYSIAGTIEDGFETEQSTWRLASSGPGLRLVAHGRSPENPHRGGACERFVVASSTAATIVLETPLGPAAVIDEVAAEDARVAVVGNPANTNTMIAASKARRLTPDRFTAMVRLDQNRARTMLAKKTGVASTDVQDIFIFGNHSPTMFPAFGHAKIGGKAAESVVNDRAWLEGEFCEKVGKRGAAIIAARGASSAASAASAHSLSVAAGRSKASFSVRATTSPRSSASFDCHNCSVHRWKLAMIASLSLATRIRLDSFNSS